MRSDESCGRLILKRHLKNVTDKDYNELCEMLQAAYDRWEKKHPEYKPDFFTVTDVEEFQVE